MEKSEALETYRLASTVPLQCLGRWTHHWADIIHSAVWARLTGSPGDEWKSGLDTGSQGTTCEYMAVKTIHSRSRQWTNWLSLTPIPRRQPWV